ncbi:hypothetical protein CEXT_539931 [Caerostris extrusa]|uniref:Uncharacterized protein n=1 Tax=Caerostris extrusa TaxID=172846 RepID=A0AAV4P902_CAEEX|nr:hypothetical protein CEXT_539931 [Caerostris extrusa]
MAADFIFEIVGEYVSNIKELMCGRQFSSKSELIGNHNLVPFESEDSSFKVGGSEILAGSKCGGATSRLSVCGGGEQQGHVRSVDFTSDEVLKIDYYFADCSGHVHCVVVTGDDNVATRGKERTIRKTDAPGMNDWLFWVLVQVGGRFPKRRRYQLLLFYEISVNFRSWIVRIPTYQTKGVYVFSVIERIEV